MLGWVVVAHQRNLSIGPVANFSVYFKLKIKYLFIYLFIYQFCDVTHVVIVHKPIYSNFQNFKPI